MTREADVAALAALARRAPATWMPRAVRGGTEAPPIAEPAVRRIVLEIHALVVAVRGPRGAEARAAVAGLTGIALVAARSAVVVVVREVLLAAVPAEVVVAVAERRRARELAGRARARPFRVRRGHARTALPRRIGWIRRCVADVAAGSAIELVRVEPHALASTDRVAVRAAACASPAEVALLARDAAASAVRGIAVGQRLAAVGVRVIAVGSQLVAGEVALPSAAYEARVVGALRTACAAGSAVIDVVAQIRRAETLLTWAGGERGGAVRRDAPVLGGGLTGVLREDTEPVVLWVRGDGPRARHEQREQRGAREDDASRGADSRARARRRGERHGRQDIEGREGVTERARVCKTCAARFAAVFSRTSKRREIPNAPRALGSLNANASACDRYGEPSPASAAEHVRPPPKPKPVRSPRGTLRARRGSSTRGHARSSRTPPRRDRS